MAVTINLKPQVDLPVWEELKFTPQTSTAISAMTTGNTLDNRYMYYIVSNLFYRYDSWADAWQQVSSMPTNAPTIMVSLALSNAVGHYGQAIAGGVNTIQLAGLSGDGLVGQKIRITEGTGAGQERTITGVAKPVIHERGMITTASTTQAIDASTGTGLKLWTANQWKNYQVRIDWGTGRTQLRPILYNTRNTLTFTDVNYLTVDPWANCPLTVATVANNSFFVIESHVATVDTNWTVQPDSTSRFVILTGGIWAVSQATTGAPFFSLSYYDRFADYWYQKSTQTGLKTAVFLAGSDLKLERFTETGGVLFTETAAGGGARYISPTATLVQNKFRNFEVRIKSGTGIGQSRTILSNQTNRINICRDWDINPDNTSVYEIWRDVGKLMMVGGGDSAMFMYSQDADQWSTGQMCDFGQCNQLAAKRIGDRPIAITSITRTATGVTGFNATPTAAGGGYNVNDILTLTAGNATFKVLSVNANGGVTAVSLETNGTGHTVAAGKATTVSPVGGTGCTLEVTAVDFIETAITPIAHNYKIGENVTISGASGAGAAKFNGTYVVTGLPTPTTNLQFSYCCVGDPGAASATIANSPSTVQVVDATKNWVINEHAGKIVQLSTNAVLSVGQQRRIVSNTATTLVWTLAATAPVNGGTKYIIEDVKPFGTDRTSEGEVKGTEGFATGGSTTTLVDSTKNWLTNYWCRNGGVGQKVRIVEGTGVGNEITIVSNTATTLTYLTQTFTPDATTRYVIMDTFGTVSGAGGISTIAIAPTAGGTGYAVGDISNVTGGAAKVKVVTVNAGVVTGLTLVDGGTAGYTVVTGVATTNTIGTGTGLTVNVTAITAIGSTTVLQDNTKNWETNYWVGSRVRPLTGTGVGNEYTITANTFNTLTFAAATALDVSTAYAILEATPKSTGISLDCITGSSDDTLNSKYMLCFTGTATPEIAKYNINTEHWEFIATSPQTETFTTGTMYVYDGKDRVYISVSTALVGGIAMRVFYYDLVKNTIVPFSAFPVGNSTLVSGNRLEILKTEDGLNFLYLIPSGRSEMFRTLIFN
jgi:hypothetical protein